MAVIDPPENVGDVEHHALVAKFCDATSTLRAVVQAGPAQVSLVLVSYVSRF